MNVNIVNSLKFKFLYPFYYLLFSCSKFFGNTYAKQRLMQNGKIVKKRKRKKNRGIKQKGTLFCSTKKKKKKHLSDL